MNPEELKNECFEKQEETNDELLNLREKIDIEKEHML